MFTEKKIVVTISIWSDTEFGISSIVTRDIERLLDSRLDSILSDEIPVETDYNVEIEY